MADRPRSPFLARTAFIASPLISEDAIFEEGTEYTFYLDPEFFLYNEQINITQIRIDFGDGQGEWVVNNPFLSGNNLRTTSVGSFIKKTVGKTLIGRIIVIGIDLAGHGIQYGTPFKILTKKKKDEYSLSPCKGGKGGGVKWAINPDPAKLAPINAQYGNPPAENWQAVRTGPGLFDFTVVPVKDTAYFFFKDDGNNCASKVVRRPVIFIDGFDPTNTRKVGDIYKDFINVTVNRPGFPGGVGFGDYMLDNVNGNPNDDLDFIILDFKHGNDLIERNAMALVALIERLNQTYGSSYLQDITLIGPSMGSLIAQYALAYMEHNNIQHRVKTYISFDGCHQGANVPIGLQNYIEYLTKRGVLKGIKLIREGLYNGLAAKQMLAHHHSANSEFPAPDALRTQFLQNLAAVGEYPQLCRKVALINGANTGALNPYHGANTTLLDIEIKRKGALSLWGLCNDNICKKIKWTARTATNSGTNITAEMWTVSALYNLFLWVPLGQKNYYTQAAWGNSALDNAPGGLIGEKLSKDKETHGTFLAKELIYLLTGDKPTFNININNFTMMPSYSAADLRFANKNLYMKWDDQYLCGKTPFDYVYAPTYNQEHVYVSEEGSVWFENEARCSNNELPVFVTPSIGGNSTLCSTGSYSIDVCKPVNSIQWSVTPSYVASVSGSGTNITLNKQYDGTITLSATINFCGYTKTISKEIIVGFPQVDIVNFSNSYNSESYFCSSHVGNKFTIYNEGGQFSYDVRLLQWPSLNVVHTQTGLTGENTLNYIAQPGWYVLEVRPVTNCGAGNWVGFEVESVDCSQMKTYSYFTMTASPNPAQNDLNVRIDNEKDEVKALGKDAVVQFQLFDFYTNQLVRQWKYKNDQQQFKLDVRGLKKGWYVLSATKGKYRQSLKILVE